MGYVFGMLMVFFFAIGIGNLHFGNRDWKPKYEHFTIIKPSGDETGCTDFYRIKRAVERDNSWVWFGGGDYHIWYCPSLQIHGMDDGFVLGDPDNLLVNPKSDQRIREQNQIAPSRQRGEPQIRPPLHRGSTPLLLDAGGPYDNGTNLSTSILGLFL